MPRQAPLSVPALSDWQSEPLDLDGSCAFGNFFGKSLEEAVCLFEKCALQYQEDVTVMPSRVFSFYLLAYMQYLRSDKSRGDADGASCFIDVIKFRLRTRPADVHALWPEIASVLEHIAQHQEFYDAPDYIYESFPQCCSRIYADYDKWVAAKGETR
jgi:hypothetical protein